MLRIVGLVCLVAASLAATPRTDALAYLGEADRLFRDERYREAVAPYEAALRTDPTLFAARKQLAICLFQIKEYDRARPLFEQFLKSAGNTRLAHYYLGRMDLLNGAPETAIVHLKKVIGPEPFQDEYYFLASANFKLNRLSTCVPLLRKQIANNPRDSRAHLLLARVHSKLGQENAAEREFAETRRLSEYYLEGSAAFKRCRAGLSGESSQGVDACNALVESDDVDKLSAVGVLFGQAQRYREARESLARAVALDPESPEIRYNLALSCFHLREFEEAKTHVAAALKARPEFPEANVLYGTLLYMAGSDHEAISVLRRAHHLRPSDASVSKLLALELLKEADRAVSEGRIVDARARLEEIAPLAADFEDITQQSAALRSRLK